MATWLPKVRVAACNVAPVFLDTAKTVQKTIGLIQEAARNKADLVAFPEVHVPGYPLWAAVAAPIDNHNLFGRLAEQSILINGKEMRTLQQACAQSRIFAHVGFNERSPVSVGCLWNSSVLISDEGKILCHHRKLMPTFYEKLTWSPGDGAGLKVVDTGRCGKVGGLICGENTNPLARWSLMAQGEQLHITSWPAVWPTRRLADGGKQYDNLAANRTRTSAQCFEGKVFGVMCSGYMDKEMEDTIIKHSPSAAETLESLTQGASMFLDPSGAQIGEHIQGEEGIVYADMDLNECVEPKQFHDVVGGGYQRYDVFDVSVTRIRQSAEFALGAVQEPELNDFAFQDNGTAYLPEQPAARPRPLTGTGTGGSHGIGGLKMT
ncbi:uncharacterized protein MYCFIDRAFT_28493 [Pseudocercospora fijiensis CIRAD86]|uniref:CN hydrolase domain-containing protein n=1 Tax=Pseudocercospora fijiensis (strain CIRAD86) TaxID=383855 RepID=M3AVB9_PSEFD|nr:uncharacterized protein MYCFIDRAFT_28493 [Pseudocercospora fijiensis CIRAD86]EME81103.1 hypothetical protein MYCFIDRAFT_28493 [Pseudocercospora fijiensis CIRAD86]